MKKQPAYRLINSQRHCSFVIKEEPFDLNTTWHYHPEVELMYFARGSVSGIMGNRFNDFTSGELLLLGENFPHVIFENLKKKEQAYEPEGVVIQFRPDFLGEVFFEVPEMKAVKRLLIRAKNGIRFPKKVTQDIAALLCGITERSGSRQLLDLLEILHRLSSMDEYSYLAIDNKYNQSELDEKRMHVIKEYLYQHFRDSIKIEKVAQLVNMTETSFCRYYKSRTLKSFTQTLNEIRISYACELLNKNYTVSEACYDSGYSSPAYFSRIFRKIVGISPSSYKLSKEMRVIRW